MSAPEIPEELKALRKKANSVETAIRELRTQSSELTAQMHAVIFGVEIGDIVKDDNGDEYKVTDLKDWRPKGRKRTKSGDWSKAEQHLYFVKRIYFTL